MGASATLQQHRVQTVTVHNMCLNILTVCIRCFMTDYKLVVSILSYRHQADQGAQTQHQANYWLPTYLLRAIESTLYHTLATALSWMPPIASAPVMALLHRLNNLTSL